jgi:hypothetical protein
MARGFDAGRNNIDRTPNRSAHKSLFPSAWLVTVASCPET